MIIIMEIKIEINKNNTKNNNKKQHGSLIVTFSPPVWASGREREKMGPRLEDFEILSTIGSGSHGTVRKVRRRQDGQVLVWKELNYGAMSEAEKQVGGCGSWLFCFMYY